jgi:acyl-homoserine lactone acylase PvdQ
MTKATNFDQWLAAMRSIDLQMFNTVYADDAGNIAYIYNGAVPKRDLKFNWTQPVDGADPATEWKGIHLLDELPQLINPPVGYVQNCNSTPFTTADDGSPFEQDYPAYMVEEKHDDKRRAKISRHLLRQASDVTFDHWQRLCFDTTLYWPMNEIPRLSRLIPALKRDDPTLASKVAPYFEHLQSWDFRGGAESTQATLCAQWYEELYGRGYPVEQLREPYLNVPNNKFAALVAAADRLTATYGEWRVPWGKVHRTQRQPNVASALFAPFDDAQPSLPCLGLPGPLGVAFTVYYTPANDRRKLQYGTTGHSFVGAYEFGKRVAAATILQYGTSGDPKSPHFFDQAELYSQQKFKPAWFHWDDVLANTARKYHPGEEGAE